MLRRIRYILVLSLILSPFCFGPKVFADTESDLLKKKAELNQQLNKYNTLADKKGQEAQSISKQIDTLQSDIGSIEKNIADTQGKIGETEGKIGTLSEQVAQKIKELDDEKAKLNSSIREIYRYSSRSDVEMIFAGGSLTDAVNQIKYTEAIQTQIRTLYEKVRQVKVDLEKQKSDQEAQKAQLAQLKGQQEDSRKNVEYVKAQKDKLLGMTIEQQKAYQQDAEKSRQEVAKVEEQIRAEIASRTANSDGTYGSGPRVGSRVKRGDFIGIQGSTGFSTGDHVHFEVDTVKPMVGYTNPHQYINNGTMDWPLKSFRITQDYWEFWKGAYPSTGDHHMGIDIAWSSGSRVFAPADGMVVLDECPSSCNKGYGHAWAMKVDNGPYVLLGHLR